MSQSKVLPLNDDVSWVGVLDEDIVTFDIVMETRYGTTYNAYCINADKKVVIDTVKKTFQKDFFGKLSSLTDPAKIDYIICNHTEPDHSGSLTSLLDLAPDDRVGDFQDAFRYYFDVILKPFSKFMLKAIDKIDALDISMICPATVPSSGPAGRKRSGYLPSWLQPTLNPSMVMKRGY